jgi:hypothetical protein
MSHPYYSSRKHSKNLTASELHQRLNALYLLFGDKDYFKEKTKLTRGDDPPESLNQEAAIFLGLSPFPLARWANQDMTEDHIFDTIEFLYDRVSKPGEWGERSTNTGYVYEDHVGYDERAGKEEFRQAANAILADWETGYELSIEGKIQALGTGGLQYIFDAEILPFDEKNVDSKVRTAISKWRGRHRSMEDMKEAVRLLADVFEYLKKSKHLDAVLDAKDTSDLFQIANTFAIRHHNPQQKSNYDPFIWHSWMFHFYLATYHASIRMIRKGRAKGTATETL